MGGTSTDVALIRNAEPAVSNEIEIEYAMPIHVPMVDVHTVGAGGGSIARVDASGLIQVGPESAGANPGPVCYGRGGTEPTITDANLVLGRLSARKLLSVDAPVSPDDVRQIFADRIGRATGLDGVGAAAAVLRLGNMKMAGAIRMVSVARGHDPRDFALFAFGGAGPLHASGARPRTRPAESAGAGPAGHHQCARLRRRRPAARFRQHAQPAGGCCSTRRVRRRSSSATRPRAGADRQGGGAAGRDPLRAFGRHAVRRPDPHPQRAAAFDRNQRGELQRLFEEAYFARFKVSLPEIRANLVNLNTSVIGVRDALDLSTLIDPAGRASSLDGALSERRPVWFDGGWRETPVYQREKLPLDAVIDGPAILEQIDATTVVEPGDRARRTPTAI